MAFAHTWGFLLLSLWLSSFISARPRETHHSSSSTPSILNDVPFKYSHVCIPSRFAKLGLKMSRFGYCDKSLAYSVRAKDLVDRMSMEEKVQQMGNLAVGVPRIGLPKYEWWSEALHGVSNVGPGTYFDDAIPGATSFPTVILTAASFNKSLWREIGKAVSTEARAMYNLGRAGLTFWSPNINVVRDPRWGRAIETPGEDPYVVGTYASNYVRGLQDVDGEDGEPAGDPNSRPLKVSACCKHYAAYDVDNWLGTDRYHFDARVSEQDMLETFLRPFEMCVRDGDVSSVMCSYNRVDGVPTCADHKLLNGTVRTEWDLHGYIVSDCDSIDVMVTGHKWLGDTAEDAAAHVLKAGMDLDCGTSYNSSLGSAVGKGKVREAEMDRSLGYLYVVLMRLGFFDGSPSFVSLGKEHVCSEENIELAAEAAREGIVLLKNDRHTLPLNPSKFKKLALLGPHANATTAMIGNYAGIPCKYVSPLEAFSRMAEVTYQPGCLDVACRNDTGMFLAVRAAERAEATILFVGLDLTVEAESLDRVDLLLPNYQTQLINQVAEASKGPVILVIFSAGGVDVSFAKNNDKIGAILWAGYPGEQGGRAVADVVFGKYNPGGRLPLTWHEANYVDMLPMTSMPLRPVKSLNYPGRTYKFFDGPTVFPFGYGLSYTRFAYFQSSPAKSYLPIKLGPHQHCHGSAKNERGCDAVLTDELSCKDLTFQISVGVENVGNRAGNEVIFVYSEPPKEAAGAPMKQVIGFERVFLPAGGKHEAGFLFNVCESLSVVGNTGYKLLPAGWHKIVAGDGTVQSYVKVSFHP